MHHLNRPLGVFGALIHDIPHAAVDGKEALEGHIDGLDCAVCAEDFAKMCRGDVLGQFLDDDLAAGTRGRGARAGTGVGGRAGVGAAAGGVAGTGSAGRGARARA